MARVRLLVDATLLTETGSSLRLVATEFENAERISEDYGDAVGHGGLRDTLEEFADSWDDKRDKMIEAIKGLGEATEGVGTAFLDADNQLHQSLTEEG